MIDIGGPAMVRAAAKNHKFVAVLTSRNQYHLVLAEMQINSGCVPLELCRQLARQAFAVTASYDSAIANYLCQQDGVVFPEILTASWRRNGGFRYGENPHQNGAPYVSTDRSEPCAAQAVALTGGKEMSYNNILDTNAALELVKDVDPLGPAVAIIKHANPAGVAIDANLVEAYHKAYLADVNAAMGGIIAVNRSVTEELALAITESYKRWGKDAGAGGFFAEVIIAPGFEGKAFDILRAREGWGNEVRVLKVPSLGKRNKEISIRYVTGGALVQERDLLGINEEQWKVVTKCKPTEEQMRDLRFAWLIAKHVKSNAIVLAKDQTLLGAGAGQMSRVNSAMLSRHLAKAYGGEKVDHAQLMTGCVLASDAFFPFPDSLDWAVQAGAKAIIEPGGSKKDDDVIAYADELGLAMIFTGTRHFNH